MKTSTSTRSLVALQSKHAAALSELERYKLIVENIEDYAIFMMDQNGYIQTWNKGAEKNKGYTADEIIGQHFSKFYLPADRKAKKPEKALELAKRFGSVENEDWRIKKDGTKFWANVVVTALYNSEGEHVGFAKVTRNLTERKQHEDSLRRANYSLREHQKELETLNASKDEFVSLASHQLRTPATIIKQLLGLLDEGYLGALTQQQRDVIEKAYACNERQLAIVSSLLKVAQIDAGKVILQRSKNDIAAFLKKILDDYAATFNERGQKYSLENNLSSKAKVYIDYDNFRMALENLIDNASKYTPAGGEIRIKVSQSADEIAIAVCDTGVGISPEDLNKLFQRFSRIPNELPNSVPGSGLGLYWANKVVALHGGHIDVQSKAGKGSVFTIILPRGYPDA